MNSAPAARTASTVAPTSLRHVAAVLTTAAMAMAGPAHAALVDRGGGLVYDTVQDITWLADMDHAKTQFDNSGGLLGDADGQMEWLEANLWANNLVYGGYTDWRLPTVVQPDPNCSINVDVGGGFGVQSSQYGCIGSEMGHLFYVDLGGNDGESLLDATGDTPQQIANLALFGNVLSDIYWSSTTYAPNSGAAWAFFTSDGRQWALNKDFQLHALAVRRGDSFSKLPEPSTEGLALLALLAATAARRRGRANPWHPGGRHAG